jgi:hypothetical protein
VYMRVVRCSYILAVVLLLVPLAAISSQSLWIDEANSAEKAMTPTWSHYVRLLVDRQGSDLQMPLYMSGLWIWVKAAGADEFALRAFNWIWWILATAAWMALPTVMSKLRPWIFLASAVSPFLWLYLDEARPYIMQYSGAVLLWVGILRMREENIDNLTIAFLYIGCVLICGSSLLGIPFAGCLLLLAFYSTDHHKILRSLSHPVCLVCTGIFATTMGILFLYYYWTFTIGAKASGVGQTDLKNIFFALYELLGFTGLGPGRLMIRENGLHAFAPYVLNLVGFGILQCLVFVLASRMVLSVSSWRYKEFFGLAAAVLIPIAFVFLLGAVSGFRVLGRHLMPVMPVIILITAWAWQLLWQGSHRWLRVTACLAVMVMLMSALSVRLLPDHSKDDYRSAVAQAVNVANSGGTVWWLADQAAWQYYADKLDYKPYKVLKMMNMDYSSLESLPLPALVVLSKPDIYDANGAARNYAKTHRYSLIYKYQAFELLSRESSAGSVGK